MSPSLWNGCSLDAKFSSTLALSDSRTMRNMSLVSVSHQVLISMSAHTKTLREEKH